MVLNLVAYLCFFFFLWKALSSNGSNTCLSCWNQSAVVSGTEPAHSYISLCVVTCPLATWIPICHFEPIFNSVSGKF